MASDGLKADFLKYVCQTSDSPLGLVIRDAVGSRLRDTNGREYIDLLGGMGVANLGHGNPRVTEAIREQLARHLHVGVYGELVQESQTRLAARLAAVTPHGLTVTYFTNSGAEAVEGALKLARKATGRSEVVCFDGAYHGDTFGALSVCGNEIYRKPFEPLLPGVRRVAWNSIEALSAIDERVAAVIVEPVQAEGGVRIPDADFLPELRRRCSEAGALLIADEVLTGFGRTGRLFACEHWGIVPDVLLLAKALGGGLPLGAFVGAPALMATLSHDPPLAHVTTFGGHPLSCAAGVAALDVLLAEDLVARAAKVGARWLARLREIATPRVRDVRGLGMLFAIEFHEANDVPIFARRCFDAGVILNWTLHRDTVIRFAPPLTIGDEEIKRASQVIRESLSVL